MIPFASSLHRLGYGMTAQTVSVIYSTLAPQAVIEQVRSAYPIEPVKSCYFWLRGLSDVYLIETHHNQFIFRISHCQWRSKADIEFELSVLDFFHQRCLPVAYPLRTINDQLSIELDAPEGKRYASLFIYAPGAVAIGDLNTVQATKLGETVAKLHQAGLDFCCEEDRTPLTLNHLLDDSWQTIAPFLKDSNQGYVEDAIEHIKHQLSDFPQTPPYWTICWGDPHSGNAHFTQDNQVTLFDFDQCGYGWRSFELAKFRQVALNTGISRSVRESFLNGYLRVSSVSEFELAAVPVLTQTAHLWAWSISLTYALRHNYSRLDEGYFSVRLEQLKKLKSPDWQLF